MPGMIEGEECVRHCSATKLLLSFRGDAERIEPGIQSSRCAMYFVYLLTNKRNGTLYLGVTSDLVRRVYEHKQKLTHGFTARYGADCLVWFETHEDVTAAIEREKEIKKWKRVWKLALIEKENPYWIDLYDSVCR